MTLINFFRSVYEAIKDPERDFTERIFLILTIISEVAVFAALIGDIITGENLYEIIVISAELIIVPVIVFICLRIERLNTGIKIIVIGLVVLVLPALFFFGGGVEGGGVFWIIFAFMYAGLVLHGKWRRVMFVLITLLSMGCYITAYFHPELVYHHMWGMFYVDSFISLILVGILCYIMTRSQRRLFTEKIKDARKEVERSEELVRSQNRFFSSMSHEIRTPINSILGLNELILRDQSASDDIVRDASGIQGAGKLLLALINDLLDFSKIEAGSMDIVPVDYNVGDMLSEIVNMIWLRAHDKGLGFDVTVDPEVPVMLYGDEVRIKQVIINLLNNAVKYTNEGIVELRVESRDKDENTAELCISVADTGMGIKKEDIPYLFDAFKRVDEGKNRHIEGTGLGLSIVKQLVELMGGTIAVNSVYGEGSTFTVTLEQAVSDHSRIGELNIHNQQVVKRSSYESSFLAPEVRILIVDDNKMNLEVEKRLLEDTDMGIDTAFSGKEALEKCLKTHYDAIFMDHLMPEMDGLECLEKIREQAGGLNRATPVIVLTANAGSENKELYSRAGFDGYLVKPVSGEAMEEILIRHVPGEKIILRSVLVGDNEEIHASEKYAEKIPVIITSSSMCDLPDSVIKKLHIPIIPFEIKTDEGVFKDGVHMDAYELIRHMNAGKEAVSSPPDEAAYTEFFAEVLKKTHHLIHISITTSMSGDYQSASEAAKAFGNVTVINSECLSSSTGILVLIACKLAQQGLPVQDIISELETVKHRLKCSFIINTTEYMARRGLVSARLNSIAEALNLHPALTIRNDKAGIGGIWLGRTKRAYKKYISRALPPDTIPDADVVFITYADIPWETLKWIEEEIRKEAYFEHVIFQQASAAISSNCGPGAFGILYFLKSNKSYNLASFIDVETTVESAADDTAEAEETPEEYSVIDTDEYTFFDDEDMQGMDEAEDLPQTELKWYQKLDCIDSQAAIKNSGSEDAFKAVLKIFYDSIPDKHSELEKYFSSEDWENYTIKIHALKSSARLVGAMELGEQAEKLEMAGKENNIPYISEHHASVMEDYIKFRDELAEACGDEEESGDETEDKPVADEDLMICIYDELRAAAESMDCEKVEIIMKEIGEYAIPDTEKEKFDIVREKANNYDYDGILKALA